MIDSPYSCVLWDVDGTIADASEGIFARIGEVFDLLELRPAPSREELRHWIGPPIFESFTVRAGLTPDRAAFAVRTYRELAARDGYANSVRIYDGVPEVIESLAAAGVPQATASTKPETQVRAILEHFDLAPYFTVIGGTITERDDKATVLGRSLARLADDGVDISRPVLIGDRHHDIEGAALHNVPVIFVTWGFGQPGEDAGALATIETPADLFRLLLPHGA